MNIKRKKIIIVVGIITLILGCYFITSSNVGYFREWDLENIVGIIAILSGVSGIIMGVSSSKLATLNAVKEYFQQGDNIKNVEARKCIQENWDKEVPSSESSYVINFFHMWGLLNRQGFLPTWVFNGSSGLRTIELYLMLEEIINHKRDKNPYYAKEFEYLAYRIYRKYKKNFEALKVDERLEERKRKFIKRAVSISLVKMK